MLYITYFNKKLQSFDEFYGEWVVDQDNPNEILAEFYSFMTDENSFIGYIENLKDSHRKHYISFSKSTKDIKDVEIIFSSVYHLYDYIIETLVNDPLLIFSQPLDFWRGRDQELNNAYRNGKIEAFKRDYLFQGGSVNLRT